MVARVSSHQMTYAEYLLFEEKSPIKHEYVRGEIFAMAGGTPEHAALAAAMIIELGNALKGKPCRVYSADLRIRRKENDFSAYPDVTVICGKIETSDEDKNSATNPKLIIEVLSDGTEAYDRGDKAAHYRQIPSLTEYAFVSQNKPKIEIWQKNERGRWELAMEAEAHQMAQFALVDAVVSVDAVYANPIE